MNDIEGIENLSDKEILELYNDTCYENDLTSSMCLYFYCVCDDRRTGKAYHCWTSDSSCRHYGAGSYWDRNGATTGSGMPGACELRNICPLSSMNSAYSVYVLRCDLN